MADRPARSGRRFNPTRVRLKRPSRSTGTRPQSSFNPTRVRLKLRRLSRMTEECPLQPHEGSSETPIRGSSASPRRRFNPTRVRLKPATSGAGPSARPLQPHEGSSETIKWQIERVDDTELQPHEGSSETEVAMELVGGTIELQPHEGSSETTRRGTSLYIDVRSFNPTRVRLKLSVSARVASTDCFNPTETSDLRT